MRIASAITGLFSIPWIIFGTLWSLAGIYGCDPGDVPEQARCVMFGVEWSKLFHEIWWPVAIVSFISTPFLLGGLAIVVYLAIRGMASNRVFESDARQEQPRAPQHGR